jgi:hypothetical protein
MRSMREMGSSDVVRGPVDALAPPLMGEAGLAARATVSTRTGVNT